MLPNNKALTRIQFCAAFNKVFQELEMNPCRAFNTHSFRIGQPHQPNKQEFESSDSLLANDFGKMEKQCLATKST